ncbi:GTP cyclohydrolase II RibA [Ciceribacter sp. L1K22]|uniref:GTP cyclohydrolase II RibA n=1 Tax=Ciceribacter sp. L1K22 TaxID=2820275 RepID=UPI001ABE9361|nr:GTP cyclohydrolase II RibA [Ciceribacter sp. L1K22]MBO3761780.1 GTP cyclohydrolase II RibA [Ciceribacter sp. L1K22]
MSDSVGFEFVSSEVKVERAVAELRFGRPVVLSDGDRRIAVLALDSASPSLFEQFAVAAEGRHSLFLTSHRATRLFSKVSGDVSIPLDGVSFDDASRLAYGLDAKAPQIWHPAPELMGAAAEIARLALLLPPMVCADINGLEQRFAGCCSLHTADFLRAAPARQRFDTVVRTRVPLRDLGDSEFVVFRGGLAQKDQVAIIVGKPDLAAPVPIRIHSSCITGDLCGSLKCDCGDQLRNGLHSLKAMGGGVLLYLDQEGRGTGIGAKMRAYGYQHLGLDTIDADAELGFGSDHRRYEAAIAMLELLGISKVVVFTNNPTKIAALSQGGIEVHNRFAVTGEVTAENEGYLRTKRARAGHMLDIETLIAAE